MFWLKDDTLNIRFAHSNGSQFEIYNAYSDPRALTDGGSHYFWVNSYVLLLLLSDSPDFFSSEENNLLNDNQSIYTVSF